LEKTLVLQIESHCCIIPNLPVQPRKVHHMLNVTEELKQTIGSLSPINAELS